MSARLAEDMKVVDARRRECELEHLEYELRDVAAREGWTCSCPAIGRCSHLVVLMLCTLKPMASLGPGPNDVA
jgi:hypothetical protein